MKNLVAIVGRPNVGKSTLYNRLIEKKDAIVDDSSGTTRDRKFGICNWNGVDFTVIDTGGYIQNDDDIFAKEIRFQIFEALKEADIILFMVDAKVGLCDLDKDFLLLIKKTEKKIILVVNKCDNFDLILKSNDFYSLSVNNIFCISSTSGSGTGELLDAIVENLDKNFLTKESGFPRIAVLGRPNVGKSTFLNTILEKNRFITSEISGTTRDSVDTEYNLYGFNFIFTDTAGIRKKNKKKEDVEFYSTMRSINSMQKSDICIVMIDAKNGIEIQDINIIALAHRYKKGIVLVVNKWDLVEKDDKTLNEYKKHISERIKPIKDIPMIFCSSLQKQRIYDVLKESQKVFDRKKTKIKTSVLNDILLPIIESNPPKSKRGNFIKIKYITQLPTENIIFAFFCNHPSQIEQHYKNFLESKIRENFDLSGVVISLVFRKK
jgi:GTP-binding protein